jgi:hypothetical protein
MVAIGHDSSISAIRVRSVVAPAQSGEDSIAPARDFGDPIATFHFDGLVEGVAYPSLSPAQQDSFKADFFREVASLKAWSRRESWLPSPPTELQIYVSDEYKIAKSLVPAALGHRGRMEFPAWKAIAGEAAIAHELVHVYFPNGNRLLAEGLAIHLQDKIGGNPTFPNFGRPLHQVARELLRVMVPEFASGQPESLEKIRLADLDKIATPSPLRLRVGRDLYENTPVGQAHIYPIAGSFAQFLIETRGTDVFRVLFERTPLIPFDRNPGSPDRWIDVYGVSLGELELEWKSMIVSCPP